VLAGVCSGIGEGLGVDPTFVRLTFALLAFASGAGIVAYLALWALLPAPGESAVSRRRKIAGAVMLVWAAFLALRGLGLAGTLVWPLALVAAGLVLVGGAAALGLRERTGRIAAAVLIFAGVVVFLGENTRGSATTLLAPGAVAVALLLVLGPWALRLARERDAERAERIRTQEREELAARVHDSVLQTLALIQREPNDPRRVATLARRQERELRAWLYPSTEPAQDGTLAGAVDSAAAEIEELHGVRVEVVRTGDAPLDERTRALVLAAREAMANASKHSGVSEVSVFLDAGQNHVALFVRDRGSGFDPDSVADDRRGIAESIRGRMERVGGTARIVSSPGEGTEVELELPPEAAQ
jgi:signal transduction histidine kinase